MLLTGLPESAAVDSRRSTAERLMNHSAGSVVRSYPEPLYCLHRTRCFTTTHLIPLAMLLTGLPESVAVDGRRSTEERAARHSSGSVVRSYPEPYSRTWTRL